MTWGCEGRMNDGRLSLGGRLDVDCSKGGGCGTRSGHGIGGPCESLKVSTTSHGPSDLARALAVGPRLYLTWCGRQVLGVLTRLDPGGGCGNWYGVGWYRQHKRVLGVDLSRCFPLMNPDGLILQYLNKCCYFLCTCISHFLLLWQHRASHKEFLLL